MEKDQENAWKTIFIAIIFIVASALILRLLANSAAAATVLDREAISSGAPFPADTYNGVGVRWVPAAYNINSFDYNACITATSTFEILQDDISIYTQEIVPNGCDGWHTLTFTETIPLNFTDVFKWYIYTNDKSNFTLNAWPGTGSDVYGFTLYTYVKNDILWSEWSEGGGFHEFMFRTYYDDQYNTYQDSAPQIDVWIDTLDTADKLWASFDDETLCEIGGAECRVNFLYNLNAKNADLNIYAYNNDTEAVGTTSLASTTIIQRGISHTFDIALTTATTTDSDIYYCGRLTKSGWPAANYCGWRVRWLTEEDYDYEMERLNVILNGYNIESACDSMASTTASSTIWYGLECGLRKFSYWATKPSASSTLALWDARRNVMNSFPLSVYKQLKDLIINTSLQGSEQASSTLISIPLIGLPGLNVTMFSKAMIDASPIHTIWDYIYNWLVILIYCVPLIYIYNRLMYGKNDAD